MDISPSNIEITSPVEQDHGLTAADEAAAGVWHWLAPIDDKGLAALASISPLQVLGNHSTSLLNCHPYRASKFNATALLLQTYLAVG